MKTTKLIIKYYGGLDTTLDKQLEESMKKIGLFLVGSGFDLRKEIRDLEFSVKEK